MISGRVLVIDGDEWTSQLLVRGLREKGYTVDSCTEAMPGFRKACETIPDCIVLAPELPDIDGAWVARRVRTESGPISRVPILFVGELTEPTLRTQTLNVGADVFLSRPISNDEVIAQVGALLAMARRHGGGGGEAEGQAPSTAAAIRGDLSAFPLASMLMMFEMERRSGQIEVTAQNGKRATITMNGGLFASTEIGGQQRPALETLREVLSWRAGRFSFATKESGALPAARASIGALVLEAMRLEDEEKEQALEIDTDDLIEEDPFGGMPSPSMLPAPAPKPEPAKAEAPRAAAPRPRAGGSR
ncbi:MAG: response regulator [Labilithrix sp.]|nr:response regulator [Labilithrix sp.]MCW5810757.1 response regulator [Labilithrix sp.]